MAWSPVRLLKCICFLSIAIVAVASPNPGSTEKTPTSSHIPQPTCSKSGGLPRIVGQYEGWSIDRNCQPFVPEQIPKGVYTHLNYAYATIDPTTFEIRPGYLRDPDMYRRFTRLKRRDPNLKVSIAIGDALDPDQIARTFSDIASSESGQRAFFDSLLSFLATYDFDGVDLNWKLPSWPKEGAPNEGYKKLPDLVANLRRALKSSGGRDQLSLTLSVPDWQLQQCNITSLEKNVDFLVLSSYTSRNTEDEGRKCLNAHTNLTDTENTLQLLWNEGVKPNHVILGTSFSGVGFTAMESTCLEPGCLYASGSDPQSCSQEIGVISQTEIEDIIRRTKKKPVLHVDAAVQVLAFDDDQWVAYDDEETLKIKAEYAQSRCLGGVMTWVSQDSREGRLTAALAQAIGKPNSTNTEQDTRRIEARLNRNGPDTVLRHKQCMWSNCGDECPAGYNNVRNDADFEDADLGPLNKQTMVDPTGCDDSSDRLWCCPTLDMPKCLWSGFEHDGICTSSCPDGSVEIASSSDYCENGGYAAACCDSGDDGSNSMILYHTCTWTGGATSGDFTDCGKSEASCPDGLSLVAQSQSGSGGVQCNVVGVSEADGHPATHSVRSYCCDAQDYNIKWSSCSKEGMGGNTKENPGHCPGDCSEGRYRVALDKLAGECASGAASICCVPAANTLNTDLPEDVLGQAEALDIFLKDPQGYCHNDTTSSTPARRQVERPLEERDIILQHPAVLSEVENLVSDMLDNIASHNQIDAWDSGVEEDFPFMRFDALESYMDEFPNRSSFADYSDYLKYHGMDYGGVRDVACSMNYYNSRSARELESDDAPEPLICHCSGETVCEAGDVGCIAFADDDEDDDDDIDHGDELRRRGLDESEILHILFERARAKKPGKGKKPRGGEERDYEYEFKAADGTLFQGFMRSFTYRAPRKWRPDSPIWNRGYALPASDSSMSADLRIVQNDGSWGAIVRATEHIMQLEFPRDIITALATGSFRGQTALSTGALDSGFIDYILNGVSKQSPAMTGMTERLRAETNSNIRRLYWTLGNNYNDQHFVITSEPLNVLKSSIWRGISPFQDPDMVAVIAAMETGDTACEALCALRQANSVLLYFNDPGVNSKFAKISNEFRNELLRQYREYNPSSSADEQKKVTDAYNEVMRAELNVIKNGVSDFVTKNAERIREKLGKSTAQWAKEAIEIAENFENMAATTQLTTSGFDQL